MDIKKKLTDVLLSKPSLWQSQQYITVLFWVKLDLVEHIVFLAMNTYPENIWGWIKTYCTICGGINIHSPTISGYLGCQGFDPQPCENNDIIRLIQIICLYLMIFAGDHHIFQISTVYIYRIRKLIDHIESLHSSINDLALLSYYIHSISV